MYREEHALTERAAARHEGSPSGTCRSGCSTGCSSALIGSAGGRPNMHHDRLHIWSGFAILTLLVFRLLWGLFGSSTARFASFVRGPARGSRLSSRQASWRGLGHTPLGALSVLALARRYRCPGRARPDRQPTRTGSIEGPLASRQHRRVRGGARPSRRPVQRAARPDRAARRGDPVLPVGAGKKPARADDHRHGRARNPAWSRCGRANGGSRLLCLLAAFAITRWVIAGAPPFGP